MSEEELFINEKLATKLVEHWTFTALADGNDPSALTMEQLAMQAVIFLAGKI